jgi:endoglucanase
MTLPLTVAPGATATITVDFAPTVAGSRAGAVSIVSNAASSPTMVTLAGTGAAPPPPTGRFSTAGNQIIDSTAANVRFKSINWFGGEGGNYTPNGIWSRGYKAMLDQIKALGFNCVRLPLADDILTQTPLSINYSANTDLVGLSAIAVLDSIINYGGSIGLYFVLDHHRYNANSGSGTDGWPPTAGDGGGYTVTQWTAFWTTLATRYHANLAVIGMDPHNEPYNPTWATWASMVETLCNTIHAIAPDWLVFVEGVGAYNGASYWWGGQLAGVASRPVVLTHTNKVIYSPHEYGLSVNSQTWLESSSNTVAGWPNSLAAVWGAAWSFIYQNNIAPIWVGEFGGKFGFTGGGAADSSQTNASYEVQWVQTLVKFLDGDTDLTGTQKGMSFAYWALNPNSGDTGGLLEDDFLTVQAGKLALIAPALV